MTTRIQISLLYFHHVLFGHGLKAPEKKTKKKGDVKTSKKPEKEKEETAKEKEKRLEKEAAAARKEEEKKAEALRKAEEKKLTDAHKKECKKAEQVQLFLFRGDASLANVIH